MQQTKQCIFCGKEGTNPVSNPDNLMLTAEDLEIHGIPNGEQYIRDHGSNGSVVCGACEDEHVTYY
jgi:hypothetical protein